jgi:hypothetical protein
MPQSLNLTNVAPCDLLFMLEQGTKLWVKLADNFTDYLASYPDGSTSRRLLGVENLLGILCFSDHSWLFPNNLSAKFYQRLPSGEVDFIGTMDFSNIKAFKEIFYEELSETCV